MGTERAHVAAFGFSNPEWVWEPLAAMQVDRLFLLEAKDDRARIRLNHAGFDIDARLADAVDGTVSTVHVELWDPREIAACIARLIRDHALDHLAANISCGPNTIPYGIALAAEYHNVNPYFRRPSDDRVHWVEPARRPWPPEGVTDVLRELMAARKVMTMAKLRRVLAKQQSTAFAPRDGRPVAGMTVQSQTNQLSRLLEKMQGDGLVEREGSVQKRNVKLTQKGEELASILALAPQDLFH